jgi:hypothetical protein
MRDVDDVRLVEALALRAAHEDECGALHGDSLDSRGGQTPPEQPSHRAAREAA